MKNESAFLLHGYANTVCDQPLFQPQKSIKYALHVQFCETWYEHHVISDLHSSLFPLSYTANMAVVAISKRRTTEALFNVQLEVLHDVRS